MNIPCNVKKVILCLNERGHRADVVGGCVRDFLMGRVPYDYDVTTDATPDEMREIFSDFRTIYTGIKHGTLTVMSDGAPIEVTTYRRDGDYIDHRHPDSVTFTQRLCDDLARRDFTMNAICYNSSDGFTDLYGGIADIEQGIIRAVGDPYRRFDEDALRIIRALRFSATLGFSIEASTAAAAMEKSLYLSDVSGERIYTEWCKLIAGDNAYSVIRDFPDVVSRILLTTPTLPTSSDAFRAATPTVRHLSLFATNPDPVSRFLRSCDRMRCDNKLRKCGTAVLCALLSGAPDTDLDLKLSLVKLGVEYTDTLVRLAVLLGRLSPDVPTRLRAMLDCGTPYRISDLAVNGRDILSLGFCGEEVGNILSRLLDAVVRGELPNEKTALISSII